MRILKLDEIPEEGMSLAWSEESHSFLAYLKNLSKIDFGLENPIQSEVTIRKETQSVFISGKVQTDLRFNCIRCLKEFSYPLSSNFEITLYPPKEIPNQEEIELGENEMESIFFEEGEIHLSEIVFEQVCLDIPFQPLCHEGCKGLCQNCGKDLNFSSCDCVEGKFH